MENSWQESWNNFVDMLTKCLQAGEGPDALIARFAGKPVVWSGLFEKADLDELAPSVYIDLPPRLIDFGDGRTATLDGISLPVADGSQAAWSEVQPGAEIEFEAIMGRGMSPFLPVTVKTFRSGRTMVTVRLSEGALASASGTKSMPHEKH